MKMDDSLKEVTDVLDNVHPALSGSYERKPPTKIVKPRKRGTNVSDKTIVAIDIVRDTFLTERGKTGTVTELISGLETLKQEYIFVCRGIAEFTSMCQEFYAEHDAFQFFCTPMQREKWSLVNYVRNSEKGEGHRHTMYKNRTIVSRLGFSWSKSKRKKRNVYHLCLDPITFSDRAWGRDPVTLNELINWGKELRDFCKREQVNLRPTQGGIGRQYLRDPRFYPEARRKVPRATNDSARSALGRITMRMHARRDKQYQAWYIDQHGAHHYQVQHSDLPDSDYTFAFGNFRTLQGIWKSDPERVRSFLSRFKGLLYCTIDYETVGGRWEPDFLWKHKTGTPIYLFTNQLDLLHSLGGKVTGIIAAWGTSRRDNGLPEIGKHHIALTQELNYGWLKPLLLSTYGCLATRPKRQSYGFGKTYSERGKRVPLPAGRRTLDTILHETHTENEPATNNVIHRGMIEAATECETILYANYLQSLGYRVLAVRVDAVVVEDDCDLPTIPLFDPWRVVSRLTNLEFHDNACFTSLEINKGVTNKDMILKRARGGGSPRIGNAERQLARKINVWEAAHKGHGGPTYKRNDDNTFTNMKTGVTYQRGSGGKLVPVAQK